MFRHAGNPALGNAAGWEPHRSIDHSRQLLDTIFGGAETYAIVLKSTGLPVGHIELMFATDFHTAPLADGEAEISYWIGQEYWGQGLVAEAAQLLIQHSFQTLGLGGLWCCHYHGNLQSKRVQEKCGFRYIRTVPFQTEYGTQDQSLEYILYSPERRPDHADT